MALIVWTSCWHNVSSYEWKNKIVLLLFEDVILCWVDLKDGFKEESKHANTYVSSRTVRPCFIRGHSGIKAKRILNGWWPPVLSSLPCQQGYRFTTPKDPLHWRLPSLRKHDATLLICWLASLLWKTNFSATHNLKNTVVLRKAVLLLANLEA